MTDLIRVALGLLLLAAILAPVGCDGDGPLVRSPLDLAVSSTGPDGRATLSLSGSASGGEPVEFEVHVSELGTSTDVSGATVTALGDDTNVLILAQDPSGVRVMEYGEVSRAELAELTGEGRDFGLTVGLVLLTLTAWDFATTMVAVEQQEAEVLWRPENFTVVCLTKEEFQQQLELGRSMLFFGTDLALAGYGSAAIDRVWQLAEPVVAERLLSGFMLEEYGDFEEYVVTVPNTPHVLNAVGSDDMLFDLADLGSAIEEAPAWGVAGHDCDAFVADLPRDAPPPPGSGGNDDDTSPGVCTGTEALCDDFDGPLSSDVWGNPAAGTAEGGYLIDASHLRTVSMWPFATAVEVRVEDQGPGRFDISTYVGSDRNRVILSDGELSVDCDGDNGFPTCTEPLGGSDFVVRIEADNSLTVAVDGQTVCSGVCATGNPVRFDQIDLVHFIDGDPNAKVDWIRIFE